MILIDKKRLLLSDRIFWGILSILLLGAALRFGDIGDKGIVDSDSGVYAGEAKALYLPFVWVVQGASSDDGSGFSLGDLKRYMQDRGAVFPYVGKPGHDILIALSYFIWGLHDYAVLFPSALLGTLAILFVYLIGRDLFGTAAGLLGALVLAVSKWAVVFSLHGLAEMNSAFFGLLAVYFYLKALATPSRRKSMLVLAGLSLGFSITVNYKMLVLIPPFLGYEIVLLYRSYKKTGRQCLGRPLIFLGMMVLPVFVMQIPFWIFSRLGMLRGLIEENVSRGFTTYFDALARRWAGNTTADTAIYSMTYKGALLNFDLMYRFEGAFVFLAILVGVVLLLVGLRRRFEFGRFVVVSHLTYMLLLWSIFTGGHPSVKAPVMVLPLVALAAGVGIGELAEKVSAKMHRLSARHLQVAAGVFVLIYGVYNSWEVVTYKSHYKLAVERMIPYIKSNDGVLTGDHGSISSVVKFYFGNAVHKNPSLAKYQQTGMDKSDSDYLFLSMFWVYRRPKSHERYLEKIAGLNPIFEFDNPYLHMFPLALETKHVLKDIEATRRKPDFDKLRVYDLRLGEHNRAPKIRL